MFKTLHRTRNFPAPGAVTAWDIIFALVCAVIQNLPGPLVFRPSWLELSLWLVMNWETCPLTRLPAPLACSGDCLETSYWAWFCIFPGSFVFRFLGDPNPPPILCALGYQDNYCDLREGENHLGPFSTIWNSSFQEGHCGWCNPWACGPGFYKKAHWASSPFHGVCISSCIQGAWQKKSLIFVWGLLWKNSYIAV